MIIVMSIAAILVGGLCGKLAWDYNPQVPFTQEEIVKTKELRSLTQYNEYSEYAESEGIFSLDQLTKLEYDSILSEGYRRSRDKENRVCWYNRKTDDKLDISSLTFVKV